jgi:hypothetical protein
MEAVLVHLWAGIDAGKAHHHCVVIDADGTHLLSQKIPNDEPALLELIADVLKLADGGQVLGATDLNHSGPALLIALLLAHGQNIRIVHHASRLYRGEGKTDVLRRRRDRRPGLDAPRPAATAHRMRGDKRTIRDIAKTIEVSEATVVRELARRRKSLQATPGQPGTEKEGLIGDARD